MLYWGFLRKEPNQSIEDKLGSMECILASILTGLQQRDRLFEAYYEAVRFVEEYRSEEQIPRPLPPCV
jgi:hypothetical protein